jgi:alpha-glucuronidase
MKDGSTLWESLQYHYNKGVTWTEEAHNVWHNKMRHYVDEQRWREVDQRMEHQVENARQWRDVCLKYFGGFAEQK